MTEPDASTSRAPARRRRRWPWLFLGGLAVLILAAGLLVPRLVDVERYRGRVEEALRSATGWEAELGSMDLALWRGLALTVSPAKLSEPGGGSKVEIGRIEVRASLLPLLRGRLDVRSIELVEADLAAVRSSTEKGWVVPVPAAPAEAELPDGEDGPSLKVTIGEVRVRNGRLLVEDRVPSPPLSFQVENLRFAFSPSRGDVSGRGDLQGGGEMALSGNLREGLGLEIDGVPTQMLHSWVGKDLLHAGGTLSGNIEIGFPLAISGRLVGEGLTLLSGERPFDKAEATFRVSTEETRWTLDSLTLVAGDLRATGKGSLRPGLDLEIEVPQTPLGGALDASRSVLPLPLELSPPGEVRARLLVDQPKGRPLTYEARGSLSAAAFAVDPMLPPLRDVKAAFDLDRTGRLKVEVLEGTAGEGPLRGVARIDPVFPPGKLTFEGGLQEAVLGQLLDGFVQGASARVFGSTAMEAALGLDLSRGKIDARALDGRLALDSRDVTLPGWDLETAFLGKLSESFGGLGKRLSGEGGAAKDTRIDGISLSVSFDSWPWRLERLALGAGGFEAFGDGTFDPVAGEVDVRLTGRLDRERTARLVEKNRGLRGLVDRKGRLAVPLRVKGPTMKPSISVKLDNVLEKGLEAEAEERARGLLEGLVDKRRD